MTSDPLPMKELRVTAERLLHEFQVTERVYLLGSLARGLTVYDQQVRAHNLAWALWQRFEAEPDLCPLRRVAVIGGGIGGLTVTACLLARSSEMHLTLFEERWDLCPLQQGSDTRWLHPHLYRWPEPGSRVPDAGLPVLNWTEGRASDVSRQILNSFGRYASDYGENRLDLSLGLNHLRVQADARTIEWMGRTGVRTGSHVRAGDPCGARRQFDAIILATGFGLEEGVGKGEGPTSYWRNDRLAQPQLNGGRATYLVSGFGDGALIDFCRLTIERFRQDTVVYELFGAELEQLERDLQTALDGDFGRSALNVYDLVEGQLPDTARRAINLARENLRGRLRKDTNVILHATGRDGQIKSLRDLFGSHSSFLNRILLYLLYRCGAFTLTLGEIEMVEREFLVPHHNVIKRYGTATLKAISGLFSDPLLVSGKLDSMKKGDGQPATRRWPLGTYPHLIPEA